MTLCNCMSCKLSSLGLIHTASHCSSPPSAHKVKILGLRFELDYRSGSVHQVKEQRFSYSKFRTLATW